MTLFDCIMQNTILSDPVPLTVGEGDTVADIIEKEGTSALQGWLEMKWDQFLNLGLRILIAVAVYFIVNQVLKHVLVRLDRQLERRGTELTARHFIVKLIRAVVLIFTIVTIIVQLNIVAASSVAALLASAGVAISLAMQGALSNFTGGLLLMLNKPFRAGDYIMIKGSGIEGTVEKVEIYYTTVKTLIGDRVLIPNSQLTNQSVDNHSANFSKILTVKVGISYDEDIERVKRILHSILEEDRRIDPSVRRVVVDELGDSGVVMMCIASVGVSDYNNVRFDLNEKIRTTFAREGIAIPYRQMDVHLISEAS